MLIKVTENSLQKLRAFADRASFLGPTLARLTVGLVFVGTGWGKLHSIPDVTSFFTDLHIPAPGFHARLVAGTEFVGGLLVLLGLGTRIVSLPLAFTMVIAILTAKRSSIDGLTTLVGFEEWSYLVMFLWIALAGPGPLSLDALIRRLRRRGDSQSTSNGRRHERARRCGHDQPQLMGRARSSHVKEMTAARELLHARPRVARVALRRR